MPNLNHIWQRFLLASSLLIGLAIGVAATIFGYSNLSTVNVQWSVIHLDGVPLWTVAVVPVALTLIAGTLYHWTNSLHHFTEHMRHRHRVHELEAEVASLRAHLDHVLEMPDHASLPAKREAPAAEPVDDRPAEIEPQPEPEPAPRSSGAERNKRVKPAAAPERATSQSNGEEAAKPAESAESERAAPAVGA